MTGSAAVACGGLTANFLDRPQTQCDDRIDDLFFGNPQAMANDAAARSLRVSVGTMRGGDGVHNETRSQQHCTGRKTAVKHREYNDGMDAFSYEARARNDESALEGES